MILFIIFYLAVGITIAVSNKQIEDMTDMPEEERMSDVQMYVLIPVFWVVFLVYETYFVNNQEDGEE